MATRYVYLNGKTKWAKVRKPDEKYQNFQVPLYMDKKNLEAFDSLGLQLTKKEDEEGTYVTFRRPVSKLIKNELVNFGPPKVLNADNSEFDGLIGNGSDVTIKVAVYDTLKGKGHRLESVRVEKLVEYVKPQEATTLLGGAPEATGRPSLPF
jgi:hypothetical protein